MIPGMYAYKTILALICFMQTGDEEILPNLIVEIFRNGLTIFFVLVVLVIGGGHYRCLYSINSQFR